jgi:hypothetical protein
MYAPSVPHFAMLMELADSKSLMEAVLYNQTEPFTPIKFAFLTVYAQRAFLDYQMILLQLMVLLDLLLITILVIQHVFQLHLIILSRVAKQAICLVFA